jgi:SPP1 gp7 family putative phage head morphogenesis protein
MPYTEAEIAEYIVKATNGDNEKIEAALSKFQSSVADALTEQNGQAFIFGEAMAQQRIGMKVDFNLVKKEALDYMKDYRKTLVKEGATVIKGEKVFWMADYSKNLRKGIADSLKEGIEQGYNVDKIARYMAEDLSLERDRAGVIARTEIARAQVAGSITSYKNANIEKVEWLLGADPCPECDLIATSGINNTNVYYIEDAPEIPVHPNCYCDLAPFVEVEDEPSDEGEPAAVDEYGEEAPGYSIAELQTLAEEIYDLASSRADSIMGDIEYAAAKTGGELVGTEFRVKSKESLLTKLKGEARIKQSPTLDGLKSEIRDSVRFTSVIDEDRYVEHIDETLSTLEKSGYKVLKVKNYWKAESTAYKGVNTNLVSKDGAVLELQFHTPETYYIKQEKSHVIYEKLRISRNEKEIAELTKKSEELFSDVAIPKNIEKWTPQVATGA